MDSEEKWAECADPGVNKILKQYDIKNINEYRPIDQSCLKKTLLEDCYTDCIKDKDATDKNDQTKCKNSCSNLKKGFSSPVFYTNPSGIPEYTGAYGRHKDDVTPAAGSHLNLVSPKDPEITRMIKDLDSNFIGALITGKDTNGADMVLGKNYVYPMDYNMKVPFLGDSINADCVKPNGEKTTRNMFIRGIPKGDIAKYIGLNLNLPEQPRDWTKGEKNWTGLYNVVGGKVKLEKVLKKLKRECKSFLYDVQTKEVGGTWEWSPVAKLKIPPECEQQLYGIDSTMHDKIKKYDSSIFTGSLRGLLPSIVEDVVDLNPISLARKSGLYSSETSAEQEKCKYITQHLGEQKYSNANDLKPYTFEVFTNYSDDERIKIICMLIVVVVLFLFIF